jgi:hypothetical protein
MQRFMCVVGVAALLALGQAANAGAVGGPKLKKDVVLAYATDRHDIRFEGGEDAAVLVRGDGDTTLILTVHDENGNLIAGDTGEICIVRWKPRSDGRFVIRVHNLGDVYNRYTLLTN